MKDVDIILSLTPHKVFHELLTNTAIHKIFSLIFILITFLQLFNLYDIYLVHDWYGKFYIIGINELDINRFTLPLLYWLGLLFYIPLGEPGLFLLGIIMFTVAFIYLTRLFWNYKFMLPFFFWIIFIRHAAANWLLFFSRDALIFMFASAFTYYFYRTWIRGDKKYWKMAFICILALYTKSSAILLIVMLIALFLYQNVKGLTKNMALAGIPLFRPEWAYSAWLGDLLRGIESFLFRFKISDIVFVFPNPLFFFSFMLLLVSRGFIPFMIVFLSVATGVVINNISTYFYDSEVIWRYMFIMVPLNLLLISQLIQQAWNKYKNGEALS